MALVLPVVHDLSAASISADTTWQYASNGATGFGTGTLAASPILHAGQFVLQYVKASYGGVDVYRQGSSGWNALGTLKNNSAATQFAGGDLYSYGGDLYTVFTEKTSTRTMTQVAKWNQSTETWEYETSSTYGIHNPTTFQGVLFSAHNSPRFVDYNGDLHLVVGEGTSGGSYTRVSLYKRNGGTWTRLSSSTSTYEEGIGQESQAIVWNGAIWYLRSGVIWKSTASSTTLVSRYYNWAKQSGATNYTPMLGSQKLLVIDGTLSIAFSRFLPSSNYSNTNQYFCIGTATTSNMNKLDSDWSTVQRSRPLVISTSTGYYNHVNDYFIHNGKEYICIIGRGSTSQTQYQVGIYLYRLDGSTWTQLGGGTAKADLNTLIAGYERRPFISGNTLLMPWLDYSPYSVWIAKTQA